MWTLFKIINIFWLLASTYAWFTTMLPLIPMLFAVNVGMIVCLGALRIEPKFDMGLGRIFLAIIALVIWSIWIDGYVMGIYTFMSYLPVIYLIILPREYQEELLQFVTKWYAILLGIAFVEYLATFVVSLPSIGRFEYSGYVPYTNHGFYIKTTYDTGFLQRFNAFFLEPGHQALLSTFLLLANKFSLRSNRYCIILLLGVIFSFSLAGYLLAAVGWALLWVDNIKKLIFAASIMAAVVIAALTINAGDNTLNNLIISRLEYDEDKGIKGNNRFTSNTDYIFQQGQRTGRSWTGMKQYLVTDKVAGAGYKIYVIGYGWIGVILAALFYLSVIPSRCNVRYTAIFITVIALCFMQRSYPGWYSWLLPYTLGIYINRRPDPSRFIGDYTDNEEVT